MKLGILLATSPEHEDGHTAIRLAEAALGLGYEASIFLMDDGVYHVHNPALRELMERGVEVGLCAHNAEERHVKEQEGFLWGSQFHLALLVNRCDRFVAFT